MGFDPDSEVFRVHEGGKLTVRSTLPLTDRTSLSLAYTPGVAEVCTAIADDVALAREYTWRSRLVAVVSDGTAVLGLGNIGPAAALPVMEGKAALFSEFAGLNAVPIVLSTDRRRRDRGDRRAPGPVLRRHQPGRHLGAAVLRHRATAARAPRHPGVPRRPARHRDRRARRAAQRRRASPDGRSPTCGSSSREPARRASRVPGSCWPPASATSPSPTRGESCTPGGRTSPR